MEQWKQFKNEFYVSDQGRIKNTITGNIRKTSVHKTGYERLWAKCSNNEYINIYVHRVVAQLFVDNPNNKPIVNHLDGDKLNNKATNLEWTTQKENMTHAFKNKLCSNDSKRKLTQNQIDDIINVYKQGNKSMRQLAEMYNVSKTTIWSMINNKGYNG